MNRNLDLFLDSIFSFDVDKSFSTSTKSQFYEVINKENETILVQKVLGIDKKDLSVKLVFEQGKKVLYIKGKTKDSITDKEYEIDTRFFINGPDDIDDITSEVKNGLLYVRIKYKKPEKTEREVKIL